MKFIIKDNEHATGGCTLEAESLQQALENYARDECHDASDGDEINVEITDEAGLIWEGTAEIEVRRDILTLVRPKKAEVAGH